MSLKDTTIEGIDESVLSKRSMDEIAGDAGSREWKSRPAGRGKLKAAWLADAIARVEKKKKLKTAEDMEETEGSKKKAAGAKSQNGNDASANAATKTSREQRSAKPPKSSGSSTSSPVLVSNPVKRPMPTKIHPMLAESVDDPFDGEDWLFEIKWDGYRAVAFIENGKVRLVSRNQNDLTPRYPELHDLREINQSEERDSGWRGRRAR